MTRPDRYCVIIPTFNHVRQLPVIVARLVSMNLPVILVDDGSAPEQAAIITALASTKEAVHHTRLDVNSGKGAAMHEGFRLAHKHGYSHALQVDADGQHDLEQLDALIGESRTHPDALVTGQPVYDDSIPTGRKIGRWITHIWVWIETLSFDIRDSMCGFRVYPVTESLQVMDNAPVGKRMDFDTDIMVRLYWSGIDVHHVPVQVIYPEDNFSNFRLREDNILITRMHTRLFFTMLANLPLVLSRQYSYQNRHWAQIGERGSIAGLQLLAIVFRYGGYHLCRLVMTVPILFFWLTGRKQRQAIDDFWQRVDRQQGRKTPRPWWHSYRNFHNFGQNALEKIRAWNRMITVDSIDLPDNVYTLGDMVPKGQGILLVTSHIGNVEMMRAFADDPDRPVIRVLLHMHNAEKVNRIFEQLAPDSNIALMPVTDMGPETAIILKDCIDRGEWVVLAGDRVPVAQTGKNTVAVPFLEDTALFPIGPWIMAHLLECPVWMLAATKKQGRYKVHFRKLADRISLPRKSRDQKLAECAGDYAAWLEGVAMDAPAQWYNFYDFWASAPVTKEPQA